ANMARTIKDKEERKLVMTEYNRILQEVMSLPTSFVIKTIPIQYLDQWLEQGYNGRIIDLRSPPSYCQGHISGAENYPFDELMDDPDLLDGSCPLLFY
ncbi:rhodanese-like domain-containing protein, partial [[Clostridium] symbiosum]|uniref:rhodanese-like domain-containing protein n=1 Tax=Clostridium symbiosum TaxID=1512 RepID=UPI00210EA9F8